MVPFVRRKVATAARTLRFSPTSRVARGIALSHNARYAMIILANQPRLSERKIPVMKRRSNLGMDKTQPALLVQHGNTAQKHRPLDRAGVTLGQARGCDIELDAPEVSSIHCIITRGPDGLYIRDCNSRMGTRINGERIREAYLHDTDILQVGPFSFQVYLPASFVTQPEKAPSLTATTVPTAEKSADSEQTDQAVAAKEAE